MGYYPRRKDQMRASILNRSRILYGDMEIKIAGVEDGGLGNTGSC